MGYDTIYVYLYVYKRRYVCVQETQCICTRDNMYVYKRHTKYVYKRHYVCVQGTLCMCKRDTMYVCMCTRDTMHVTRDTMHVYKRHYVCVQETQKFEVNKKSVTTM